MLKKALRSLAAIVLGYAAMAILVVVSSAVIARVLPWFGEAYYASMILSALIAALAGGWIAARIGSRTHARVLAAIVLVLGIASAFSSTMPIAFALALPVIGAMGVALGGRR